MKILLTFSLTFARSPAHIRNKLFILGTQLFGWDKWFYRRWTTGQKKISKVDLLPTPLLSMSQLCFCSRSCALKIAEFYYRNRRFRSRYPVFEAVNNRGCFFSKVGFWPTPPLRHQKQDFHTYSTFSRKSGSSYEKIGKKHFLFFPIIFFFERLIIGKRKIYDFFKFFQIL